MTQAEKTIAPMESESENDLPADKRRVVIRPKTFRILSELAEREESDIKELANRAIREFLERAGLWPPKPDAKDGGS